MNSSAPSILPSRVRVPFTPSMLLSIYIWIVSSGKDENKQKEARIGPYFCTFFCRLDIDYCFLDILYLVVRLIVVCTIHPAAPDSNPDRLYNLRSFLQDPRNKQIQALHFVFDIMSCFYSIATVTYLAMNFINCRLFEKDLPMKAHW